MAPKVSVVIPVYNVENYVRPCIESALAQTLQDIEIIIVDDGSTDSCPAIIDYYAAQDSRIIPVHKNNEGYGKACNTGFDMAQGEFIAILESDDFIDEDMYEKLYDYAIELGADVVKSPYKDVFMKDEIKPYPHNDFLTRNMPRKRLYSIAECPCQLATHQSIWAALYKTSYMREHNIRFDEVPGAGHVDIKFCVESLVQTDKLAWYDYPFYSYRVEREGSSTAEYSITENAMRYREMHDFLKSYDDELFRICAPALAARECTGLYRYFKKTKYTEDDIDLMRGLLLDFTDEEIMRAPLIKHSDKEELLLLKGKSEKSPVISRKSPTAPAAPKSAPETAAANVLDASAIAYRAAVLALLCALIAGVLIGYSTIFDIVLYIVLVFAILCGIVCTAVFAYAAARMLSKARKH